MRKIWNRQIVKLTSLGNEIWSGGVRSYVWAKRRRRTKLCLVNKWQKCIKTIEMNQIGQWLGKRSISYPPIKIFLLFIQIKHESICSRQLLRKQGHMFIHPLMQVKISLHKCLQSHLQTSTQPPYVGVTNSWGDRSEGSFHSNTICKASDP